MEGILEESLGRVTLVGDTSLCRGRRIALSFLGESPVYLGYVTVAF
jgi:hypothetical protein